MLVIASLFPELGEFIDLTRVIHVIPQTKISDSLATKIAKLGLALEEHLSYNVSNQAMLLWSRYDLVKIDSVISQLRDFSRDQISFPTLDIQQSAGWTAGHSIALTRWAAVCRQADHMDLIPWPHRITKRDTTANLVWWAQRINLRVYEASL